jgi:hypothetical protein
VLGLNISSAFDSAVTIYILIPVLIIPQLLLGGVVINFDRVNPAVGRPDGIPVMGEMMASRWAFEAFMVTQFKDNPFEKEFYELDKKKAMADYKRVYHIPTLESKLAVIAAKPSLWRNKMASNELNDDFQLLKNEIRRELLVLGNDKFQDIDKIEAGKFDSATYQSTAKFLRVLKEYYGVRFANANRDKETLIAAMTSTPEKESAFHNARLRYTNESVTRLVENSNDAKRIIEWKHTLIQKIYPIYANDPRPSSSFDFTSVFYSPVKHFMGRSFDTLYFNISIIWMMTLLLYLALHFDVLSKVVNSVNMWKKYRRKRKIEF